MMQGRQHMSCRWVVHRRTALFLRSSFGGCAQRGFLSDEVALVPAEYLAGKARRFDFELMSDLHGSKIWLVSNADAEQLARGSMSDQCRPYCDQKSPADWTLLQKNGCDGWLPVQPFCFVLI
jgi:hypothetical protein